MKLTFKNGLHNCDKHLGYRDWREGPDIIESICFCDKCGRIKNYWSYGQDCVTAYKPRDYTMTVKSTKKGRLPF